MRKLDKFRLGASLTVVLASSAACGLLDSAGESGYVRNSDGTPLSDVYVVTKWHGDSNPIHPDSVCLLMYVTKTNEDGYFYVPSQFLYIGLRVNPNIRRGKSFYKPGYSTDLDSAGYASYVNVNKKKVYVKLDDEDWYLKKSEEAFEERIESLRGKARPCPGKMIGQAKGYFTKLRQEALSLAKTEEQKRLAWNLELEWWLWSGERQKVWRKGFIEKRDLEMRRQAFREERGAANFDPSNYLNLEDAGIPSGRGALSE